MRKYKENYLFNGTSDISPQGSNLGVVHVVIFDVSISQKCQVRVDTTFRNRLLQMMTFTHVK